MFKQNIFQIFIIYITSSILFSLIETLMQCSRIHTPDPDFYLIGKCFKSQAVIIAHGHQRDLEKCKAYAIQKRGLAFNFRKFDSSEKLLADESYEFEEESTCQVLDCPEYENFTSLVDDSYYDYYSFYGDPLPNLNFTCVPSVGLFNIHKKRVNYSQALEICEENSGDLAHILSESRTNAIANLIKQFFNGPGLSKKLVYVGLQDTNNTGNFETPLGEPLSCFSYRAWAPSNPKPIKKNYTCVAMDANRMWHAVDCEKKLPFICELYPGGPLTRDNVTFPDSGCK